MKNTKLDIKDICKRIATARKCRDITQAELSKRIGKAAVTISDYENLRAAPPVKVIQQIADALDIPTTYLLYGIAFTITLGD